ncbi:tRNA (adenine(58)-N(1))-methyltransferase non-catalytic subunit trm6 [Rhodotorula kratochvilovae]
MADAAAAVPPAPGPAASTSAAPPPALSSSSTAAPAPAQPPAAVDRDARKVIRAGDNVLLKLPSGVLKPVKVNPSAKVSLGKYGTFLGKELVGRPYGHTYEVADNGSLERVKVTLNEIEETEANNEFIASQGAQTLSAEEIQALKESGLSGREIIQKQIEEHKSFELKTEYSKEKYLKRKEAKWMQVFTPLEPTVHQIAQFHFEKQPSKTRELRPDTLANMLAMANVRPGSRLLVVEDMGGMIAAAAVERMGGEGRIMVVNDADSPPDLHLLETFNFSAAETAPLASLHWAATDPSWAPPDLPLEAADLDRLAAAAAGEAAADPKEQKRNSRDLQKLRKRKATFDKAKEVRDDYFAGGFDGVIIACEYEPYSIIERLLPRIAGSASIVVYSPHMPLLFNALLRLRQHPSILAPTIHEPFLREYQVLPGRAHPQMQGMASGGFVLSMLRVYENDEANAVGAGRRKRKAAAGAGAGASAPGSGAATPREEGGGKRVKLDEGDASVDGGAAAEEVAEGEAMKVDEEAGPPAVGEADAAS